MPERSTRMSGEELHAMGKRAAARWGSRECRTLTEAVTSVVKESSGLNTDQVRRVVEFANTEAHGSEFRKQGSPDRVVEFTGGPASAADVLRALNDGSAPASYTVRSGDYDRPPPGVKQSADEEAAMLAQLFPHEPDALPDPLAGARALRAKVAAELERAVAVQGRLGLMEYELTERVIGLAKTAVLEGTPLSEIARAWQTVGDDGVVKLAFRRLLPRLLESGAIASPAEAVASLEKSASKLPINGAHPLVVEFRDFRDVTQKVAEAKAAEEDARAALSWFDAFEKDAGKEGILPAAVRHLGGAARVTEGAGRAVGGALGGETGANVLGFAGKALPYAATGLAANEAYRQTLKYNPLAQAAKANILAAIPGTQEYAARDYELAMGGGMY